jgi:maltooligosyltrehalose trehalohydrolase
VYFLEYYHVDALRLDAIHAVFDMGAMHFWQYVNQKITELSAKVGRPFYTIAESDLNDTKVIKPIDQGGWGFSSQWMDDFHHSLHALLTGEQTGYYEDFGKTEHLAKCLQEGFVYNGTYSDYRKRKYGNSSARFSGEHFVVYTQNHDQIGNRMLGDRLTKTLSFEALKPGCSFYAALTLCTHAVYGRGICRRCPLHVFRKPLRPGPGRSSKKRPERRILCFFLDGRSARPAIGENIPGI